MRRGKTIGLGIWNRPGEGKNLFRGGKKCVNLLTPWTAVKGKEKFFCTIGREETHKTESVPTGGG